MNHIDDVIRALSGPQTAAALEQLIAFGDEGLDRLLDVLAGHVSLFAESPDDFRDIDSVLQQTLLAFARKDLTGTLRSIDRLGGTNVVSVVWALGQIVDARLMPALHKALHSRDPSVRWRQSRA